MMTDTAACSMGAWQLGVGLPLSSSTAAAEIVGTDRRLSAARILLNSRMNGRLPRYPDAM